jgi:hypothetical protein
MSVAAQVAVQIIANQKQHVRLAVICVLAARGVGKGNEEQTYRCKTDTHVRGFSCTMPCAVGISSFPAWYIVA